MCREPRLQSGMVNQQVAEQAVGAKLSWLRLLLSRLIATLCRALEGFSRDKPSLSAEKQKSKSKNKTLNPKTLKYAKCKSCKKKNEFFELCYSLLPIYLFEMKFHVAQAGLTLTM